MLILPIEDAKPGMVLAAPVPHPEHSDQDLLKSGYVLQENVLQRLRGMEITSICVDYPGLDDLDKHLAANLSPARQKLYSQIRETIVAAQKHSRPAVAYNDYYVTTRELILTLMSQGQHPVYIEHLSRMGNDAVTHATAVAHLSLLLGIKLETYLIQQRSRLSSQHAREVVNIGVGGMLHDMGKLTLPDELQKYTAANPPEDPEILKKWQEHAEKGYDLIRRGIEPSAAAVVMHHHQRWDGSGFPETVYRDGTRATPKETRIHVFARIVATANLFDRLATPMHTRVRKSNLQVLHEMRTRYESWCDPTVFKVLQQVTPPFPPGAMVSLSDGSSAVVIDVNQSALYRPVIKRIIGEDRKVDETRVDLSQPDMPTITHVGNDAVDEYLPVLTAAKCAQSDLNALQTT